MKFNFKQKLFLILMVVSTPVFSQNELKEDEKEQVTDKSFLFSANTKINAIYFSSYNKPDGSIYKKLTVVSADPYLPCPDAVDPKGETLNAILKEELLGEKTFDMVASAALAAQMADKRVNIIAEKNECDGDFAKMRGLVVKKD